MTSLFGWIVLISVFIVIVNGQNWSINDILRQSYNPKSPPVPNGILIFGIKIYCYGMQPESRISLCKINRVISLLKIMSYETMTLFNYCN